MSSVKKAKKNKSELENKNPPKILKTEVKKTMSKSSSINTEDKKITNEPIEKFQNFLIYYPYQVIQKKYLHFYIQ